MKVEGRRVASSCEKSATPNEIAESQQTLAHSEGTQSALDPLKCSKTFKSYGPKIGHVSSQINLLRIRRIREVTRKPST